MVRKQFLVNLDSAHVHDGLHNFDAFDWVEKETTSMNELSSTQILFILLFQIGFRLIGEHFDFFTKVFLFILVDVLMVLIVAFEAFKIQAEWQTWLLKVFV